ENDLGGVAVIFGGRRPALFLNRELGRLLKRPFVPPRCFSMDDFVRHLMDGDTSCRPVSGLDACHLIYGIARSHAPALLAGRESFSRFLPWAREIASLIDQLDLEEVTDDALRGVRLNAEIGYEVPASVNALIAHLSVLRREYHRALRERGECSRGLLYSLARAKADGLDLPEFERLIFCNLFYLHAAEEKIIRVLHDRDRATLIFQRDEGHWPVFQRLSRAFAAPLAPPPRPAGRRVARLTLCSGADTSIQVGMVREIVSRLRDPGRAVVVLPDATGVIPLVTEIAAIVPECNLSMGYPVTRSVIYSLFEHIAAAHDGMRDGAYYVRDYLRVFTHPLVKNLSLVLEPAVTRVIVHKVEEVLRGEVATPLGGSLFVKPAEIECLDELYRAAALTLQGMGIALVTEELPGLLAALHRELLGRWERVSTAAEFAGAVEQLLDLLLAKGGARQHALNLRVLDRVFAVAAELRRASFSGDRLELGELFRIFMDALRGEKVSFSGSPLKGLQVLGLLETRALNFDHVIVMDVNESVLPRVRACEPLIPRQVLVSLGLNRMETEEEIQRYHFMRLIAHASEVSLVYNDSTETERSRFIEELLWEAERREGRTGVVPVRKGIYRTELPGRGEPVPKRSETVALLSGFTFSPSSVNTYLECPLRFYYRYVLRLREREELGDEIDGAEVGIFIHRVLHDVFAPCRGMRPSIDREFRDRFFPATRSVAASTAWICSMTGACW
ncbi:MAG: PD-(D/E)XK nuclease family protein, partial [Candidatus Aureabacteria bacterium]|nr:PD-(D/E)XK nuclease family protein [Candidatus Auribacterota bacterium]